MKKKSSQGKRPKSCDKDMMDTFSVSPWISLGKTLPTSTKKTVDVFDSYRPSKQCVDYKISETWAKMQKGDIKVNVRQTYATYEDIPPEICKPQRKTKIKLFSGGPPQWKFLDELWREQVHANQIKLRKELKIIAKQKAHHNKTKEDDMHSIVQSMVGPDWFMELSPKQLLIVDQLPNAVYWDIRNRTTTLCEQVMAGIGLILGKSKEHIRIALQHSCGNPVEFLLVLYQLIDAKRTSYSLNDRLLLSSVVHLSIVPTLRELHIRIPSPPKETEGIKTDQKKEKRRKYNSPYLAPQTFNPAPPKYSGIYKNKHKQYPDSPYFSYIETFNQEKRNNNFCFNYTMYRKNEAMLNKMKEYKNAQEFYESLPGVKKEMLHLIPPSTQMICFNMLNPRQKPPMKSKLIAPHLCKVTESESVLCFCEENSRKRDDIKKKVKRSCCEKTAQGFIGSLCTCDDCTKKIFQQNLVKVHGGFQKTKCKCEDVVPIIQGTCGTKVCDCINEYRNKIMNCAARQRLQSQYIKRFIGGVIMTKLGPVYNILGSQGGKICLCSEIIERKTRLKKSKGVLLTSGIKYINGGINISAFGPVYTLGSVVARKPCKCLLRYWHQLDVLTTQNRIQKNPMLFVNNGLILGRRGPIFHLSNVLPNIHKSTDNFDLRSVCSCEIRKTKCFDRCLEYFEYKKENVDHESTSAESGDDSELSSSEEDVTESNTGSSDENDKINKYCIYCEAARNVEQQSWPKRSCQASKTTGSTSSGITTKGESNECKTTSEKSLDISKSKPCHCKEALDRFMKAKCPCEECNRKIRQSYATHVLGGTKTTASGGQVNVVQGIHQPLCSCLHDHLERVKKIDEYKGRIKARYELRKQQKKYCISGVKNTAQGPIYIISGIRPSVECECGKAVREKEELEAFEKQRAKLPNTGRIKYEISGVKAMKNENIYILSRALNISPCACEKLLSKFESAHEDCIGEFEKFLELIEEETRTLDSMDDEKRNTFLGSFGIPDTEAFKEALATQKEANEQNQEEIHEEFEPVVNEIPNDQKYDDDNPGQHDVAVESGESAINEITSSSEDDDTSLESGSEDASECGSCHVDNPKDVKPIIIPREKILPDSFLSKRFAIFRRLPQCKKTFIGIVKHILEGMAEDGFPLAKLPQAYKLPIFKLWVEWRMGMYWTYEDKLMYFNTSKYLWKHTDRCYRNPNLTSMPYSKRKARKMTWKNAKEIKKVAARNTSIFYRNLKQITIDTGREFFATTFPYEFHTCNWRDCAFAYLPSKEQDLFPYRITKSHDTRNIPENKKFNCYC